MIEGTDTQQTTIHLQGIIIPTSKVGVRTACCLLLLWAYAKRIWNIHFPQTFLSLNFLSCLLQGTESNKDDGLYLIIEKTK